MPLRCTETFEANILSQVVASTRLIFLSLSIFALKNYTFSFCPRSVTLCWASATEPTWCEKDSIPNRVIL